MRKSSKYISTTPEQHRMDQETLRTALSRIEMLEQQLLSARKMAKVMAERVALLCTKCHKPREQDGVSPSMKGKTRLCTKYYKAKEKAKYSKRVDKMGKALRGITPFEDTRTIAEKAEEEYQKNLEIYQKSKLSRGS